MSIYFLTEFFKYFFRVLHEASSSRLKFGRTFTEHPVLEIIDIGFPRLCCVRSLLIFTIWMNLHSIEDFD
jgi:hypothetical protein